MYRFGWSNESLTAAQAMAEARVAEAMAQARSGARPRQREQKVPYNGADGLPIREEILAEDGTSVITRNSYGAHCLNTPDVLIADVDFDSAAAPDLGLQAVLGCLAAVVTVVVLIAWSLWAGLLIGVLGWIAGNLLLKLPVALAGGVERWSRHNIERFARTHTGWRLHLYRTPAGFRVIATHRRFDPVEPEVAAFFKAIRVDRQYARMTTLQRCFRARLTAKPWRAGVSLRFKPRPGVWPINPARAADRQQWIDAYEPLAARFAACTFLTTLGEGTADPHAEQVRELHDERSRATLDLPLA